MRTKQEYRLAESMTHDVRAIANFVLDVASKQGIPVTNMAMNKIVYFLYVDYLLKFRRPFAKAKIEAWEHGPVFREIYSSFKNFADQPIQRRATRTDPATGETVNCSTAFTHDELELLESTAAQLVKFSASRLRALSHAEGGPWHRVWNHEGDTNVGMQITDELILNCVSMSWRQ